MVRNSVFNSTMFQCFFFTQYLKGVGSMKGPWSEDTALKRNIVAVSIVFACDVRRPEMLCQNRSCMRY